MSELQTLIDMGFTRDKAERALAVTNNKGVEPAMEWLLVHGNDLDANTECVSADSTNTNEQSATDGGVDVATGNSVDASVASASSSTPAPKSVKSLKCEDCNRLFSSQAEVEFHAIKTNHHNFSESTEEKKPLTEDEKKEQMARVEEKLRQKRAEREAQDKQDALEREKMRIRSGKDMADAQRRIEEQEMKKIVEQRKREKQEDRIARDKIRAQIEADKAARREQMALLTGKPIPPTTASTTATSPSTVTSSTSSAPAKTYTSTRIQIRLLDGSTLVETFDVKEQLSAVRLFIQMKQGIDKPFSLMTNFPRKVYEDDDYEKPLEILGLFPSAVLIVTKAK